MPWYILTPDLQCFAVVLGFMLGYLGASTYFD